MVKVFLCVVAVPSHTHASSRCYWIVSTVSVHGGRELVARAHDVRAISYELLSFESGLSRCAPDQKTHAEKAMTTALHHSSSPIRSFS